jgi:hypothetical protein
MGLEVPGGGLLAGKPSSPAGWLLQWDWWHLVEVCWLAGRHRQQAGSYNGIGGTWWRFVGWQAVIASKPAPTMGLEVPGGGLLAGKPAPTEEQKQKQNGTQPPLLLTTQQAER